MSNPFHLAIPAGDLNVTTKFYVDVLGCKLGNKEADKWIDVDFWGNELTLHKTEMKLPSERQDVDMGNVPIPHFGVVIPWDDFDKFARSLSVNKIQFTIEPYIRFEGLPGEQKTMFFYDNSGNALEFKSFKDMNMLFSTKI